MHINYLIGQKGTPLPLVIYCLPKTKNACGLQYQKTEQQQNSHSAEVKKINPMARVNSGVDQGENTVFTARQPISTHTMASDRKAKQQQKGEHYSSFLDS